MGEAMRAILPGLTASIAGRPLGPALADDAADIRARLEQWTEDFNAKRVEPVCDLFSKELLSTVRGQGDTDYATRCDILTKSLNDPAREYHYDLDLHEVIVEGDLAVVRLTWTLFVTPLNVTVGRARHRRLPQGSGRQVADHPLPVLRGGELAGAAVASGQSTKSPASRTPRPARTMRKSGRPLPSMSPSTIRTSSSDPGRSRAS